MRTQLYSVLDAPAELQVFDDLCNELTALVDADSLAAAAALMLAQLPINRGMIRTALITMKPIRHLPEIAPAYQQLTQALKL